jgi:DNA repair and recombination protein RAD52
MSFTAEAKIELAKPLDKKNVKPPAPGKYGEYVEGWHVIAEANRIFGFDGWTRETVEMKEVRPPELVKANNGKETWRVGFICKVRITAGGTVVREGTGYGSGAMPDLGEAYESAVKEAETDAMKRAMMTFGNPFGLALYDKTHANVQASPPPPSDTFPAHQKAIEAAPDMAALKIAFDAAKADKSLLKEEADALILAKELRKRQLTPAPKTLGEHLDNIQQEQAA